MWLKQKAEEFKVVREEAKRKRMGRLRGMDLREKLKKMLRGDARFRGRQEKVIQAIVRGYSPIIQVARTGKDKSLSFILPAFCSRGGLRLWLCRW